MAGHARVDPGVTGADVPRMRGEALAQVPPAGGEVGGELVEVRPGALGVDVVGGQGRDPAQVVDAGADQGEHVLAVHEVGRRLDGHARAQDQARHGDGGEELVPIRVVDGPHRGVRLGAEVLDDHLLQVPELAVQRGQRQQTLGALGPVLPDSHQDPRGERHRQAPGVGEGAQPHGRVLVGAAVVRLAGCGEQAGRGGLEHHPHRRRDRLEPGQLRPAHHAGVEVRQQAGLLEDADRHGPHIVERRRVAARVQPLASLRPPVLRPVPQREQRLLAPGLGAAAAQLHHLVRLEVHALAGGAQLARHRDERAVVATIAAQAGQRDEDLARVGDHAGAALVDEPRITPGRGQPGEPRQVLAARGEQHRGLGRVQRQPVRGPA